ncbi:MAG: class I SAM-dependent methyltransferase [Oscillospiraceae bacterium]|nr:class I SAM-dependent methyltransferase [Oscillospiraceae bacterium]
MKIPISKRLLACAACVCPGARVADVGTDHGYLGVFLLRQGIASSVTASDLREKPLRTARENAARFGVEARMRLICCDGLSAIDPASVDTVVCAGMGADCICEILRMAPWLRDSTYRLILQPQSSGQDLRRWLTESGFSILQETLAEDGGFLYTVLEARYGGAQRLTPGQQFLTPQLLNSRSPLLSRYRARLVASMEKTVAGIRQGGGDKEKLCYYETALRELLEREESI